ncbi:hypothetical protein MJO28_015565 [Puccinia striiformis f. sp. tritici]|uniref:Uncharacterized protein n=1 Tax=Puccinia striiformis f. sp. tritici TaxID=168172 RepID=A0ACC0DR06_9BASI|nr:hypothetical protein MJO28_015565 [Puccinia striiformis f. sp. tritici]
MELVVIKHIDNLEQFFSNLPENVAPNRYVLRHTFSTMRFPLKFFSIRDNRDLQSQAANLGIWRNYIPQFDD